MNNTQVKYSETPTLEYCKQNEEPRGNMLRGRFVNSHRNSFLQINFKWECIARLYWKRSVWYDVISYTISWSSTSYNVVYFYKLEKTLTIGNSHIWKMNIELLSAYKNIWWDKIEWTCTLFFLVGILWCQSMVFFFR